ncbi:MAG: sigma-70 family RNA polymerase sigma factor [Tannerella sp.]|jgi:RNA polymerase sigma-70 factor (ECF subfamily)|nr:sigma-70 family RNA polymerase sigma factor [Tannerella sp.]
MDKERFKTEIIPLRQSMLAVAVKMLGNEDDAQDAVQEAMLRLWEMRADNLANPAGYAMQTLKNYCLDRLRSGKETVDAADTILEDDDNPYLTTERRDAVALVRKIIATLPRTQKMLIEMRDIEGYELEEIAAVTGAKVSAVTMNLSRARKTVRDRFIQINNYQKK